MALHDLGLKSNFDPDILRSTCIFLNSSRGERRDGDGDGVGLFTPDFLVYELFANSHFYKKGFIEIP